MLKYNLDIEKRSSWLITTPNDMALSQPFYCTEAGLFYAKKNFNTSRTDKPVYLLFYTIDGSGIIEQNDQVIKLEKNQALLINCQFPQSYKTDAENKIWHHYWIHIDGKGVGSLFDIINPSDRLTPYYIDQSIASSLFEIILKNLESDMTESIIQDSLTIHRLLNLMVQSRFNEKELNVSNKQRILNTASYIKMHYQEKLDTYKLTKKSGLSKSHMMSLFRKYIGTTPYNYLLNCRITAAKELLSLTDLPVGEIALKTGFDSTSNFSVRFQKITGESPLEYRKNSLRYQ